MVSGYHIEQSRSSSSQKDLLDSAVLEGGLNSLPGSVRVYMTSLLPISLTPSSAPVDFTHLVPSTLSSCLDLANLFPTSGPLHLLFSLAETLFHWALQCPLIIQALIQPFPFQETFLDHPN